jgi:ABC-type cobalamin/Fe3+-siderophores transport system ATPase subunit
MKLENPPMFTRLHLKNFKAWKDTGEIALKPVTMLLGTNSSGKSSLIQSLLLLMQTVRSPDRTVHLNLGGDDSDLFNFGDFDAVVKQKTPAPRQFSISFDFEGAKGPPPRIASGQFECTYGQSSSGSVVVQALSLKTEQKSFKATRRDKGAFSIQVDEAVEVPGAKGRHFAPERSIALSADTIALLGQEGSQDGQVAEDLSLAIRRELIGISYLGPLRRKPERDYVWNKSKPGEIGSDGHRAIDMLLASRLMRGKEQNILIDGVSTWLARMKIAEKLEVQQVGRSTRYEVVVHRDGVMANLRDVGIGISQVLPVLTVAIAAPEGSTILLEEPEIHLHPLAQSVLAELFVEVSRNRKVQFIVETHSEHLFRRLQTLMAQKKVTPELAATYFVESRDGEAHLRALELDEFGTVRNWPPHFFGDSVGEARAQAMARAEQSRVPGHG